ncbi:hypothetical protein TNCT_524361, partial [Trichonephila clavata]
YHFSGSGTREKPNRLTEDEIRAMVQAVCDEPEDENEVGRSDTSDDELIQERIMTQNWNKN